MAAVQEFFITGVMHRPNNCTGITLVPKIVQPVTVKEYRLAVQCCSRSFLRSWLLDHNLSLKILLMMHKQDLYLKIADNIILSHELVQAYGRKIHHSDVC